MDTLILTFHDDDDECIEFEAIVDTLDPICSVIDADDEPPVPDFPGCTLLDTSYGAEGTKNSFMVDYDMGDKDPLEAAVVEATLRSFVKQHYGITVLGFAPLPPQAPAMDTQPCRGPMGR